MEITRVRRLGNHHDHLVASGDGRTFCYRKAGGWTAGFRRPDWEKNLKRMPLCKECRARAERIVTGMADLLDDNGPRKEEA